MTPFPGLLPTEFKDAVSMLTHPYEPIPEAEYNRLEATLIENGCDFFIRKGGQIVTIGTTPTGTGWAIMPLTPDEQIKLKERNRNNLLLF